jgi:alkanesulfonate monooxygenase SsuD/methylene tetrahydromethanopterin reductase-like flavin-dependent oxidoreductase (luciferase family)
MKGRAVSVQEIVFGFGAHSGIDGGPELLRMVQQADRDGLNHFSLSDHPYIGERLDAYASIGFLLGRTQLISGFANVTNLPTRPAPMLARTVTTLSALSGGRIVLGMGAGGLWDRIADMGVERLSPADAVEAFEEAIVLVKMLSGGGPPVTHEGRHYQVNEIEPSPVAAPPVWTGSVGPKSLAATGRVADGWIPGHAADWHSERYRTSRPVIDEAAAAVGRDPHEIRTVFNFPGRITDRPLPATRDTDGRWIGGSVDQWVEELTGAVLDHDASGFTLFSADGGTQDIASLGRWAGEIAPAVREAIAK